MAGVPPEAMGKAPRYARPSRHDERWLSPTQQNAVDHQRALILRREARKAVDSDGAAMLELAGLLDPAGSKCSRSPVPISMASSRYVNDVKDRVCGHLWQLVDGLSPSPRFFTAVPRGGDIPLVQLAGFNPKRLVDQLRSSLYQCGVSGQAGILFAVVEAEYQSRTQLFRFHWHGVASGGKLKALNAARKLRAFYSPRRIPGQPKPDVAYRMKISRRELYNLPDPLTYMIKPWFARWTNDNGGRGRRCRLPDDALVEALLWLHQWGLSDCNLVMGLRCHRLGFTLINLHE